MNVLKLLRCFWKHPITRTEFKAVNYYVQYERINHLGNQVIQNYGEFKYVSKHEDNYDQEIYQKLHDSLSVIPNIQQFNITTHETVLYDQYEEKKRALFSNMAFGYDYRDLQINTLDRPVVNLATRIYYSNIANQANQNAIFTAIPLALNLNVNGNIPSLIRADFLDRQRVDQILDRENGIDLSRFL
jgi:hypothetical protein